MDLMVRTKASLYANANPLLLGQSHERHDLLDVASSDGKRQPAEEELSSIQFARDT